MCIRDRYTTLKDLYDGTTSKDYYTGDTKPEGFTGERWTEPTFLPENVKGLVETVTTTESGKNISTIKVLTVSDCK